MTATDDHLPPNISGGATPSRTSKKAQIAKALVRLSLRVTRRAEDEADHEARLEIYLDDLMAWPTEIVLKALDRWPEESRFWPSWHELLQLLNRLTVEAHHAIQPDRLLPEPKNEQDILERLASFLDRGARPFTVDEKEQFERWHHWAAQMDGELAERVTRTLAERKGP